MFSQACKYGIRATLYLAVYSGEPNKIGVHEIAEALQVPKHFLAKILQLLSKHNLISSTKGPKGGFYLHGNQCKQSIQKVIECLDGADIFSKCILGLPKCSTENPCPMHMEAYAYREGLKFQLQNQSIEELSFRIRKNEIQL